MGLVLSVTAVTAPAHAQSINTFDWKTSGAVTLKGAVDNIPFTMRAEMLKPGGDSIEMATQDGRISARVNSYPGFVSIIVFRLGIDTAQMFLLEQKGPNKFEQMNALPIYGRGAQMPQDLQYSLDRFAALKNLNGKDPSFAFRTMVSYFEDYPDRKLDAFADDVERGIDVVRVVPKPETKVTGAPEAPPLREPKTADNYPQTPAEIGAAGGDVPGELPPPTQPRKKKRRPQPGDLDYFPPPPQPNTGQFEYDPWGQPQQPVRRPQRRVPNQQGNWNGQGQFDDGRRQPQRQVWDPFAIFR